MRTAGIATLLIIQMTCAAAAAGNFEFAVPAEAGLNLEITGFGQNGAKLFDQQTSVRENHNGTPSYYVRVDDTILSQSELAKWCVINLSGQSSVFPASQMVCDEHPAEVRGTYTFSVPVGAPPTTVTADVPPPAVSMPNDAFTFTYGLDVAPDVKVQVEAAMAEVHAFFLSKLGITVTVPVAVYVSADPIWMADAYLKETGQTKAFRKGKIEDFKRCNGGEAHYGSLFMCLTSDVFSKDWFGSGLAAQRTFALTHEYFHDLQFQLDTKRARKCCTGNDNSLLLLGPQWLVEGSAEYMAFTILGDSNRMPYKDQMAWQLENAAKVKTPLAGLETRKGYYAEPGASYAGLIAVDMLARKDGFASLPAFWSAMGTGAKWQKAFETAFGETPAAFYAEYDKAIH